MAASDKRQPLSETIGLLDCFKDAERLKFLFLDSEIN